jgi:holin-like protein
MTKTKWQGVLIAHLYSAVAIAVCLFIGKAIYAQFGGLPGSIYGMMVFALALRVGLFSEERLSACIDFYVKYMSVAFLPAVVGVIAYGELFVESGWKILLVAIVTTVIGIVLAGLFSQMLLPEDRSLKAEKPTRPQH